MITICLAVYNGEKYLREQLDSLFSQTYQDWKLLIHDDNSQDNSVAIINEYQKIFPTKIEFIEDDIRYGSSSANFGSLLEQCRSEYIMFCDQDDIWEDDKIGITLQKMKELEEEHREEALLVFSDLTIVDKSCNIIDKSMWNLQKLNPNIVYELYDLLALNVVTGCTVMINKIAQKLVLPIPPSCIEHDHWMAVNIAKYGYISFVNKPLLLYRQHDNNTIGSTQINIYYFMSKIRELKKFRCKYSYFNFQVHLGSIFLRKVLLNMKRLIS